MENKKNSGGAKENEHYIFSILDINCKNQFYFKTINGQEL